MSATLDEFITLTPLTCVQQVNAVLTAASPRPRGFKVFYTLFGVYCGVLAYRAYRTYCKRSAVTDAQAANVTIPAVNEVAAASPVNGQLAPNPSPILLQPADASNTDMSWRYGPPTASELKLGYESGDDEEKSVCKSNGEPEVPTVSVGTSTVGKSEQEDKIEGESPNATTFSV
ncbi:uncharacterized protein [Drosophila kikkawai]|uniref:OCIA domain-containing protein 1 n=1 Tax=Drosophila kikkawai TaxID=30033 RepID=A0A6P4I4X6_DROKI|nr:uncharacterized protein LOC108072329 [Drosophila kikkawai]